MCASALGQDMDIIEGGTTAKSDPDWELPPKACWQGETPVGSSPPENCVSSGESHYDPQETREVSLAQLGLYNSDRGQIHSKPAPLKYHDSNWHAKSLELKPCHTF